MERMSNFQKSQPVNSRAPVYAPSGRQAHALTHGTGTGVSPGGSWVMEFSPGSRNGSGTQVVKQGLKGIKNPTLVFRNVRNLLEGSHRCSDCRGKQGKQSRADSSGPLAQESGQGE